MAASSSTGYSDGLFAVAPMMDYTNQYLRFLLRTLTRRSTLYTEMVTANTLVHCGPSELSRFLGHEGAAGSVESPLVLQIGGSEPAKLQRAAAIAEDWGGFSALNLNCGCPSDRVAGAGCFGAALMRSPELVAGCCEAMADGSKGALPITVKCRIGVTEDRAAAATVDDARTYDELAAFVDAVSSRAPVRSFQVHARKAVLGGLSPAQNRQIPPLRYGLVRRLAAEFPHLRFSLNGGVETLDEAVHELTPRPGEAGLAGVMLGRAVIGRPWEFARVDSTIYGEAADPARCRREVLEAYCDYAEACEASTPQRIRTLLLAPPLNLFAAEPNGRRWRRAVDTYARDRSLTAAAVLRAAAAGEPARRHARRAARRPFRPVREGLR